MAGKNSVAQGFGFAIGVVFAIALLLVVLLVGCPVMCATGTGLALVGAAKSADEAIQRQEQSPTVVTKIADPEAPPAPPPTRLDISSPGAMIDGLLAVSKRDREAMLESVLDSEIRWRLDRSGPYKYHKASERRWMEFRGEKLLVVCEFAVRPNKAIRGLKRGSSVDVVGRIRAISFKDGTARIVVTAATAALPTP